ncbi:RNA pseudouridine synthase family protein [Fictibacillus macauensis ZFHKF-1]|uniref:Pseudouridine synthase n=1 Tax=Fictibacillus macauensis ZFHKF-1 TaxID=1196324 RepID=I8IZ77_9BACL|nr:23S rRNA pseudouridine(2604) synthase RluF [Fictibacillus macauensis]EIT84796.1 RNA pseudouridine synthase family protein [Fictibacillus macauensis ZFHKF-1]
MNIFKFISENGNLSRREAKRLLEDGKLTCNGERCTSKTELTEGDVLLINGKPLEKKGEPIYLMFNKPIGVTTTAAKHIEGNIIDYIGYPERVFPIGRLDKASQGLILLTNDGQFSNRISHSDYEHEKEYIVTLNKPFTSWFVEQMAQGVQLPEVKTKPCVVEAIDSETFRIVLTQGLNRQIRRMSRALGYTVTSLKRIRIMSLSLDTLPIGEYRAISEQELLCLKEELGAHD